MTRSTRQSIRVLVSHTYPLLACGLEQMLGELGEVEVVSDDDGITPDIVVADYHDGLARVVRTRRDATARRVTAPKVVIVTEWCREQDVRQALEAGVAGYLQQDCTPARLADCIRQVAAGLRYIESDLAMRMAASLSAEALTGRECEVLAQVALGHGNKAIGNALGISVGTVKAHMKAIMAKLQAATRTEAASIALRRGLVDEVPRVRLAAAPAPAWRRARADDAVAMMAG